MRVKHPILVGGRNILLTAYLLAGGTALAQETPTQTIEHAPAVVSSVSDEENGALEILLKKLPRAVQRDDKDARGYPETFKRTYANLFEQRVDKPDVNMAALQSFVLAHELDARYDLALPLPPPDASHKAIREVAGDVASILLNQYKWDIPGYAFINRVENQLYKALDKVSVHGEAGGFNLLLRPHLSFNADNPLGVSFTADKGGFQGYGRLFLNGADAGIRLRRTTTFNLHFGGYVRFDDGNRGVVLRGTFRK